MNDRDLKPDDLKNTIWRYMPFSEFVSLLTYQALWFSKLNILQDRHEGLIPATVKAQMAVENQRYKAWFNTPEHHQQIDAWPTKIETDGRELIVVSCWFESEEESRRMWDEYGNSNEAVAIKSTIGRLEKAVAVPPDRTMSHRGRVRYVDHDAHAMSTHTASQAFELAFLKDRKFVHEQEVRLATLNFKSPRCVAPDGKRYTAEQAAGAGINNFDQPGLYVCVSLHDLISEVVVCPSAQPWLPNLVRRIVELASLSVPVIHSSI